MVRIVRSFGFSNTRCNCSNDSIPVPWAFTTASFLVQNHVNILSGFAAAAIATCSSSFIVRFINSSSACRIASMSMPIGASSTATAMPSLQ